MAEESITGRTEKMETSQEVAIPETSRLESADMVFSQVIATVAMATLDCLPDNKEDFLNEYIQSEDVLVSYGENMFYISGSMESVLACRNKLANLIQTGSEENLNLTGYSEFVKKEYKEIGINCDLLNEIEKHKTTEICLLNDMKTFKDVGINCDLFESSETQSALKASVLNTHTSDVKPKVLSNICYKENGNLNQSLERSNTDEINETPSVKLIVSKSGRVLKRPYKLEESVLLSNKVDTDEINDDWTGVDKEIKPKRKVGRPRKHFPEQTTKIPILSEDKIVTLVNHESADEFPDSSNILIDAMKTLQPECQKNINSVPEHKLNKLQVQEGRIEMVGDSAALDNKKTVRKFYEDRMPYKYFCQICSFMTKRKSHYDNHVQLHNKNPLLKLFECDVCEFKSLRQSVLHRHKLSHETELIPCDLCSYKTNSKKKLAIHFKLKHENQSIPKLRCTWCNFETLSKTKLMNHVEHHGKVSMTNGQLTFQCNECKYKTQRKEHLVRHKNNVHSTKRPFLCDLCGAAFKRIDALAAHKVTHIDKSRRKLPYCCFHCKKAFKSRAHMKEHMSVHTNIRSFQCHICGQMFKTKAVQRKHQQSIHFNPRAYKCRTCSKDFNTKYALQRHARTHEMDLLEEKQAQMKANLSQGQGQQQIEAFVEIVDHGEGQGQVEVRGHEVDPEVMSEVVAQVEEQLDENMTAIQTITIATENFGEFTQQLQTVDGQMQTVTGRLQSGEEIGEVYISGLGNVDSSGISILNMQGEEVRQIYIPQGEEIKQIYSTEKHETSELQNRPQNENSSQNENLTELREIYVSSADSEPEYVKHVLISSNAGDTESGESELKEIYVSADIGDIDSEQIKQILLQHSSGTYSDLEVTNQVVLQVDAVANQSEGDQTVTQTIEQSENVVMDQSIQQEDI